MSEEEITPAEAIPRSPKADAITNFQLVPDNGGFVLLLGSRRFDGATFGQWPTQRTEITSVSFLSYSMAADLSRILSTAVLEFEKLWGHIPVPGVDKPRE